MTTKIEEKVIKKPVLKKAEKAEKTEKAEAKATAKKETLKIKAADKKTVEKKVADAKKTTTTRAKKTTAKAADKQIEIKEVSKNQVKIVKKTPEAKTLDKQNRAYATGKRKNAIAKVWLKKGSGKITINGMPAEEYLKRDILDVIINVPFDVTNTEGKYDADCEVLGGGLSGQAGAIKHGISKALLVFNTEAYRKDLKQAGLLTRDSRVVERKKAGLKKARKGQVFSKR